MATFLIESSYDVEQIHLKLGIVSVNTFIAHLLSIGTTSNKQTHFSQTLDHYCRLNCGTKQEYLKVSLTKHLYIDFTLHFTA